jgi:isoamylase
MQNHATPATPATPCNTMQHLQHLQHPGTYAGMVERLDYLQNMGINAVELLPVQVRVSC